MFGIGFGRLRYVWIDSVRLRLVCIGFDMFWIGYDMFGYVLTCLDRFGISLNMFVIGLGYVLTGLDRF